MIYNPQPESTNDAIPHRRAAGRCLIAFFWCLYAGAAYGQQGAITLPRNLAELSTTADRILQGKVVAAVVAPAPGHPGLKTVVVTLAVGDVLKGAPVKSFTFQQFIWDARDIASAAGYRPGEEVLLFLNRATPLGLTSPVGLEQGRFRVMKNRKGELVAINGSGNAGLLSGAVGAKALNPATLSAKSKSEVESFRQGPISLSTLKESVRAMVRGQARAQ